MVSHLANYLEVSNDVKNINVVTSKPVKFNSLYLTSNYQGSYLTSFNIKLETAKNDKVVVSDMQILESKNGVYTIKITGNNPTITVS